MTPHELGLLRILQTQTEAQLRTIEALLGITNVEAAEETGHCPACRAPEELQRVLGRDDRMVTMCQKCGHQYQAGGPCQTSPASIEP